MRIIGLSAVIVTTITTISAQVGFNTVYGTSSDEANFDELDATDMVRTLDGGFIFCGGGPGVVKTDEFGTIEWSKTWTIAGYTAVCAKSIHQASDSGYVIAGHAYQDMFIIRTNAQGTATWARMIDPSPWGDQGCDVIPTTDGGYMVAGRNHVPGPNATGAFLCRLNSEGDTLWTQTFHAGYGSQGKFSSVVQTVDGGFIAAGYTNINSTGGSDVLVLKMHADGNVDWKRVYGSVNNDEAFTIRQCPDGGYIVGGKMFTNTVEEQTDAYVLRLDASGDTLWTHRYGGASSDRVYAVEPIGESGFIMTGASPSYGNGSNDMFGARLDQNGEVLWAKVYGGSQSDLGHAVAILPDGGFVFNGWMTTSQGLGGIDLALIRTDSDGSAGCFENSAAAVAKPGNTTMGIPTAMLIEPGMYFLEDPVLTEQDGFGSLQHCMLGLEARSETSGFVLAPNPTSGRTALRLDPERPAERLSIFDARGSSVFNASLNKAMGPFPLDLEHLCRGLYLVQLDLVDGTHLTGTLLRD